MACVAAPQQEPHGKARITIRLDEDLLDHFFGRACASGGAMGYQTLVNDALRQRALLDRSSSFPYGLDCAACTA